jgi:polysaccharide biosynthesis protein PslH
VKILYVLGALQHPSVVRGALRHYHFARLLARRHSITVLVLARGSVPASAVSEWSGLVERFVIVPVEGPSGPGTPLRLAGRVGRHLRLRRALRRMRETFDALVAAESFDAILFHGKTAFPVIAGARTTPTVIDFCDATSLRLREQLRRASPWTVPWRLASYLATCRTERRLINHSPHVVFISERDREAVAGPACAAPILPNGIDLGQWTRNGTHPRGDRLVFTGVMSYPPNEDAALVLVREVLPRLHRARPDLHLELVGLDPTAALLDAARDNPAVTVTGFVPDMRPHLEQATVYVAPMRFGSGLQNKILEAMAMEVPVVTSPLAAAGIQVNGLTPPLRVATNPTQFATEVLSLLSSAEERRRLAREGREFVEAHFSWTRGATVLERLCARAAGRHHAVARGA